MIRASEQQLKLLQSNAAGRPARAAVAPREKKNREDLPENIVTGQIVGFLQSRGWVVTRQHVGVFRRMIGDEVSENRISVGERGMTDWRAERPVIPEGTRLSRGLFQMQMFYVEIKAPGKRPSDRQLTWMRNRNAVGFTAVWFDSLSDFLQWYAPRFGR